MSETCGNSTQTTDHAATMLTRAAKSKNPVAPCGANATSSSQEQEQETLAHFNEGVACVLAKATSTLEELGQVLSQKALAAGPAADAAQFWGTRVSDDDGPDLQVVNAEMRSRATFPEELDQQAAEARESAGSTHYGDGAR